MLSKKNIALTILAAAGGTLLILSQSAWGDQHGNSAKLEGAWVAKMPGTPFQWNYVLTPTEPCGQRATLWGTFTIPIPGALYGLPTQYQPEELSVISGEVVMTGRNEAKGTVIWWGLKNTVPGDPAYPIKQVVHIGVNSFTLSFTAPGKAQVTHHMKFYDPSADANGDGLPDPGQKPVFPVPPTTSIDVTSIDTCTSLSALGFHP
jgi:hypothetical protein